MSASATALRRVAIVGAGRMGVGIVESLLIADLDVTFADATPELSEVAHKRLRERMNGHAAAGLIPPDTAKRAEHIHPADSVAAAAAVGDLVIEAVTEDLEVKREVLGVCDASAHSDAIIASNTSSLPINELVTFVNRPERFLGMHWFNPPEWTPGVEVIPSERTLPEVVDQVVELLQTVGKRPSRVTASTGFVANRLQMALFCEAARCVEEGLASPSEIDEVVRSCFGFRLPFFGVFQIADMAGLDVYEAVLRQHRQAFGDRFTIPRIVSDRVRAGRKGTTAGSGFYDYPDGAPDEVLVQRDQRYAALSDLLRHTPPLAFDGGEAE